MTQARSQAPPPTTVRQARDAAMLRLHGEEARLETEILLAHALGTSRAWLFAHPEVELDDAARARFEAIVAARAEGRPIAYLTGTREFYGLALHVSPNVLIPRADTERLVECALTKIRPDADCAIADLGTGSGAIALALAHARPRTQVIATDASVAALAVARGNAQRLGIDNVTFATGDWCAALGEGRFQVIVSNPPYIAGGDAHLAQGDLRFEPRSALVSGVEGLDAIRTIVADAQRHLDAAGCLLIEHGSEQGAAVRALMHAHGFRDIETALDLERRERVTSALRR